MMPPKKKQSSPTDVCCICCQAISAKDDALLCVGRCQQRLHRYCASVSEQQYKMLCEDNTPFLCPSCYREQHEGEVKELKGAVETLKAELCQLKELLREVQGQLKHSVDAPCTCNNPPRSYAATVTATTSHSEKMRSTAARGNTRGNTRQHLKQWQTVLPRRPSKPQRTKDDTQRESHHSSHPQPNSGRSPGQPQREKVSIPGVRKVWGTMKACTTQTVSTTIAQLCPSVAGKLQLRRKFKTNDNGRVTRWWFLIRGEEEVLIELKQIWERVSIQTSWRLEECFVYRELPLEQSDGAPPDPISLMPTLSPSPPNPPPTTEQSVNISTNEPEDLFLESQ